jgi:hypothetical protein
VLAIVADKGFDTVEISVITQVFPSNRPTEDPLYGCRYRKFAAVMSVSLYARDGERLNLALKIPLSTTELLIVAIVSFYEGRRSPAEDTVAAGITASAPVSDVRVPNEGDAMYDRLV